MNYKYRNTKYGFQLSRIKIKLQNLSQFLHFLWYFWASLKNFFLVSHRQNVQEKAYFHTEHFLQAFNADMWCFFIVIFVKNTSITNNNVCIFAISSQNLFIWTIACVNNSFAIIIDIHSKCFYRMWRLCKTKNNTIHTKTDILRRCTQYQIVENSKCLQ